MGRSTLSKNHPTSGCVSIRNPYTAKTIVSASRPLGENLISFSTPAAAPRQPSGALHARGRAQATIRVTSGLARPPIVRSIHVRKDLLGIDLYLRDRLRVVE